jgi:Branched-chain amino acid ABC-type transport system, permease components
MDGFIELFLSGITRGSIYALIALGYTMVYGIIELINFAHGEIYMIGSFVALVVASLLGSPVSPCLAFYVWPHLLRCYGLRHTALLWKSWPTARCAKPRAFPR